MGVGLEVLVQASHFLALPEKPIRALSTGWLCHITPSGSGTSPSFFVLKRFATHRRGR